MEEAVTCGLVGGALLGREPGRRIGVRVGTRSRPSVPTGSGETSTAAAGSERSTPAGSGPDGPVSDAALRHRPAVWYRVRDA